MSTKTTLLEILLDNKEKYISGQDLADKIGVSRNAVWKAMEQLRSSGYKIESKPSTGYKLVGDTDLITTESIKDLLQVPCNLKVFDTVDSTNNVAKEFKSLNLPTIVIANKQTAGRGRMGRTFYSPANSGLYMSIAFKPLFDLNKSMNITMATAVAVCRALEKTAHANPKIKWVNDIFVNGKKVCGILTEGQTNFESGQIESLIVGIGVNCFPSDIPKDLSNIAGPVSEDKSSFSRSVLAAEIINQFFYILDDMDEKSFLNEYRTKCFILGKPIYVYPHLEHKGIKARAIDIADNGGLIIEYMEGLKSRQMTTLTTGEVSIRLEQ